MLCVERYCCSVSSLLDPVYILLYLTCDHCFNGSLTKMLAHNLLMLIFVDLEVCGYCNSSHQQGGSDTKSVDEHPVWHKKLDKVMGNHLCSTSMMPCCARVVSKKPTYFAYSSLPPPVWTADECGLGPFQSVIWDNGDNVVGVIMFIHVPWNVRASLSFLEFQNKIQKMDHFGKQKI